MFEFELECMTSTVIEKTSFCEVLCGPNEMCGPDYGTNCMPDCDPSDC